MMPVPVSARWLFSTSRRGEKDDVHAVAAVVEAVADDAVVGRVGEGQVARRG
jgi:hypothetical protein